MTRVECPREQDVLDALASRRWPHRAGDELRAHVATCGICADLVTVAGALLDDESVPHELPPASLVWWRAQLRAREEAARAALRPIRVAQLAAVICAAAVVIAAVAALVPAAVPSFAAISEAGTRAALAILAIDTEAATDFAVATLTNRGMQLALGGWLVLAPVAAYLAFSRD